MKEPTLESHSEVPLRYAGKEAGVRKEADRYTKDWKELKANKDVKELDDTELLRALLAWNRYRVERASKQAIEQGHALRPEATLKWVRRIAAGESIPDEIAYASPDSGQGALNEQVAAFDAFAFVEQYNEKRT